ncbi:MAG: Methionyl-tRNA formyltransferase [Phycisphaerae bacterium]|nr:Methionyl-tRNA formyltransferase [Phycisphaerae bacterium]
MRIIFFGSGEFAVPTLRHLADKQEVVRVVSQPDRPSGRRQQLTATPVKSWGMELKLDVSTADDVNQPDFVNELLSLRADLAVVIAFGQKIGPALLQSFPGGCLNAHASLLPQYRGAAPIHWAIINGDERTGVTVFRLNERMDAGPTLSQRWTFIKEDETTSELHDRLAAIAVDAMNGALALYQQHSCPPGTIQDESQATRAPKLRKSDGLIDFSMSAEQLGWLICGLWEWPAAHSQFVSANGQRSLDVLICRARESEGVAVNSPPGTIDERMLVATGEGMLEILEVQPAGGQLMTWPEFVNGRHVQPGDRFVTPEKSEA